MANSDLKIPGNMKLSIRDAIDAGSAQTLYFGTYPQHRLAIALDKNGASATVDVTTDTHNADGSKLTTLAHSAIIWNRVSSGTDDYFAGDSNLISGVKIITTASNAQLNLTQVDE